MSLRERWITFTFDVATGARWRRLLIAPIGFIIFVTLGSAFIFIAFYLDAVIPLPKLPHSIAPNIISITLIIVGVILTVWSMICFFKVKGTPVPFNPPPVLVVYGPYKYARNPMLTGLFMQLFGVGLLYSSCALTVIFTPLFIIISVLELKYIEEPELEKRLGSAYIEYRNKTPMFFPKNP